MNVYRGNCEKCGQTVAYQSGWHKTPYRNVCDGRGLVQVDKYGRKP